MTPELLIQRRWAAIAEVIDRTGGLGPVIMPPKEGGGILIICHNRSYHFFNHGCMVDVDICVADTGEMIEGRRRCFRFDAPLVKTVTAVVEEIASDMK